MGIKIDLGRNPKFLFLEDTEIMDYDIYDLPITERMRNGLYREGIFNVREFVAWYEKQIKLGRKIAIRNVGANSWKVLWNALFEIQLECAPNPVEYARKFMDLNGIFYIDDVIVHEKKGR